MIKFVSDSSCDLYHIDGVSFTTAALSITTDHKNYSDDIYLNVHTMLDELLAYKGKSHTACPSVSAWLSAFEGQSDPGELRSDIYGTKEAMEADEIYVVTLTGTLSGTYNSACLAREMYLEKHPEAKILVIDSLSVGAEVRLLVEKLIELKAEGCSFDEVCRRIRSYSSTTRVFFSFISLHNLVMNGRVGKLSALAAGALNISIIGTGSPKGEIQPLTKGRGEKRVLATLLDEMLKAGYNGGKIRITHVENKPLADKMAELLKKTFPDADLVTAPAAGLCSYYGERGGLIIGCETEKIYK